MNKHSFVRIAAILVLAVVFALLLRWLFVTSNTPPQVAKVEIQVAASAMSAGLLIKADDLAWREIPVSAVVKGNIAKGDATAKRLLGAVVRHPIEEGAALTEKDVVFPDAPGFLAAALQPEMRAVSVAIDDVTGNAGLILPGDRVDLILTQRINQSETPDAPPKVASETILSGVRVIAVGSQIRVPDSDAAPVPGNGNGRPGTARTVTLEVDPRDGEKVTVASRLGQLSLALRSLATYRRAGDSAAETPLEETAPVWGEDVSEAVRSLADKPVIHTVSQHSAPLPPQIFHGGGKNSQ
jgi:pilus assembly protein CpaB